MWVPVVVWQPCELLYTCYLLTDRVRKVMQLPRLSVCCFISTLIFKPPDILTLIVSLGMDHDRSLPGDWTSTSRVTVRVNEDCNEVGLSLILGWGHFFLVIVQYLHALCWVCAIVEPWSSLFDVGLRIKLYFCTYFPVMTLGYHRHHYYFFNPVTHFPRNEKNMLCNIKSTKIKLEWTLLLLLKTVVQ